MANILSYPDDVVHWNTTVDWNYFEYWLTSEWERDTPGMFGDTKYGGMGWSNIAPAGISMFPRDWIDTMAKEWMDNSIDGFFGEVPLTTVALKDWPEHDIVNDFAVVPDANWYMIRSSC